MEPETNSPQPASTSPAPALTIPMAIVVAGAIIGISIYASNAPRTGSTLGNTTNTQGTQPNNIQNVQPTTPAVSATVSVDDDPVLGNPDAPITMVEFSDYECPFCQRHFQQSYPQLKADYIDTGKVKLVFRDLPLPFHDPAATQKAIAAHCVREQRGDTGYFDYHDLLFTDVNKKSIDDLVAFAGETGADESQFRSCLEAEKYKDEVQKDLADASAVGANATPTFFVGLSTDSGTIEGKQIVGAQPYESVIKPAIEELLSET